MNPALPLELEQIRDGQSHVHRLVQQLDYRIDALVRQMEIESLSTAACPVKQPMPPPLPVRAPEVLSSPEVMPPPAADAIALDGLESEQRVLDLNAHSAPGSPGKLPEIPELPPVECAPASEPLELRVGTYWLARIGIVILLTGLVFLGNYAYHRIIPVLGPWGKLSLLALAGGLLTGGGLWLEKAKETLQNYGRVLLAGGVATLYYTIYAAHYVAPVKVIDSPLLGGTLLLTAAAAIIWFADRRRSETVAMLAILLSYYTSAINPLGAFTLFSNLLLTSAAVFFLIRHGWTKLSFAGLVATYGSYGFWRWHQAAEFGFAGGSVAMSATFLACYWALFTLAVFLAERTALRSPERIVFLTLNNGAFFAFSAHRFAEQQPGSFWIYSIGFGAVLLFLSWLVARRSNEDTAFGGAYLAQGLLAITLGLVMKLTGPELAIVLAVESAVLLTGIRSRYRTLCEVAAGLCALGAFATSVDRIGPVGAASLTVGLSVGALLIFDAWWVKYLRCEWRDRLCTGRGIAFATLGLLLVAFTLWRETPAPWQPSVLALIGVAALPAIGLSMLEIALPAQALALLAAMVSCVACTEITPSPWWTPAPVLLAMLILMHWWQRSSVDILRPITSAAQVIFASAAIAVALCWARVFHSGDAWLVATSALAAISFGYGLLTRSWPIAVAGQASSAIAAGAFVVSLANGHPHWLAALSPVIAIWVIGIALPRVAPKCWSIPAGSNELAAIGRGYRVLASLMFAGWALEYVPAGQRVAFFAGIGAAQIFLGSVQNVRGRVAAGAAYAGLGMVLFWLRLSASVNWLELLALLAIPSGLRWGQRFAEKPTLANEARHVLVSAALVSLWVWVSRWTMQNGHGGQLTAAWAFLALAVFAAGLALRDRVYRFGGFAILGVALFRLFAFDVWGFDTLYRIVSFLVLGAVLLILSFVYSRFAETLRRWL